MITASTLTKVFVCLTVFAATTLLTPTARPQEEVAKPEPVDLKVKAMLVKDPSTHGQIRAYQEARRLWEEEMNVTLAKLNQRLPEGQRQTLRKAQADWATFRDSEQELRQSFYAGRRGTMWGPIALEAQAAVARARAITLRHYVYLAGGNE